MLCTNASLVALPLGVWRTISWGLWGLAWAQATVLIENADELGGTPERRILRGNVQLRQDTLLLLCAEAILTTEGAFTAQGGTQTVVGKSGVIHSATLRYDPHQRRLLYEGGVRANFPPTTFEAPKLIYDRSTETLWYEGGGNLRDTTGIILSERGFYFVPQDLATFGGNVRVYRETYQAHSDSLLYDTRQYIAQFPLPFYAYDTLRKDTLYAKRATWHRGTGEIFLHDSSRFWNAEYQITARDAYYHAIRDSGVALCDVRYEEPHSKRWAWADTAYWWQDTLSLRGNASFLWGTSPPLFLQSSHMTAYKHQFEGIGQAEMIQFPLLVRSDTLRYDTLTRTAQLRGRGWVADTAFQVWADWMRIRFRAGRPDSAWARGQVGLLARADTFLQFFHQVRADSAEAAWDTLGLLSRLRFAGQVQVVYYQEEGKKWRGAHYVRSTHAYAELDSLQRPRYLRFWERPKGTFWSAEEVVDRPLWIQGMRWLGTAERPRWPFYPERP